MLSDHSRPPLSGESWIEEPLDPHEFDALPQSAEPAPDPAPSRVIDLEAYRLRRAFAAWDEEREIFELTELDREFLDLFDEDVRRVALVDALWPYRRQVEQGGPDDGEF